MMPFHLAIVTGALGLRLTALLLGLERVSDLHVWLFGGETMPEAQRDRFVPLYDTVALFIDRDIKSEVIRLWFGSTNAMLDGRAPALVLPEDPQAVLDAARRFIADR